jgi:TatD DNase family protein
VADALAALGPFTLDDIHRITSHTARRLFRIGNPDMARIAYSIRNSLYLGITNRCTLSCVFCPKTHGDLTVKGHTLRLNHEPTIDEIMESIGEPLGWKEIVFCGYGETTLRLDTMKEVARRLKKLGVRRIRLDTDGLANFVHERDVTPELDGLIDALSVSLNAPDAETYTRICRPSKPGNALEAVKDFIRRAKAHVPEITATAVGMPNLDVEACRGIAEVDLGVMFRCREYNVVG